MRARSIAWFLVLLLPAAARPAAADYFYRDADGDGFGFPGAVIIAPSQPPGHVANNLDCDDDNSLVHPGAPEYCNGIDDDCDGLVDDNVAALTIYRDVDGDGYGAAAISSSACPIPAGYVTQHGDCDDSDPQVHPGAVERCGNGIDDDCDGVTDDLCGAPFAIAGVTDVAGDEGHAVAITWTAHPYDAAGGAPETIVSYEIRRRPPGGGDLPDDWAVVATVPAATFVQYQAGQPTACDQVSGPECAATFVIRAIGFTPGVRFDTAPSSGSSVDNLPPLAPVGLSPVFTPNQIALTWNPGPSPDVALYRIYRTFLFEGFPELSATRSANDRQFTGPFNLQNSYYLYSVSAVDTSGNESPEAYVSLVGVDPQTAPAVLVLAAPAPNPSRGTVATTYDVSEPGARVRVGVYDLAGRRVRALLDEIRPAGRHVLAWDGTDDRGARTPAGSYFLRLESDATTMVRKLVRLP